MASFLPVFMQTGSSNGMSAPRPAVQELSPAEEAGDPAGKVCTWGPGVCRPCGTGGSQPQAVARDLGRASVYPSGWEKWSLFSRSLVHKAMEGRASLAYSAPLPNQGLLRKAVCSPLGEAMPSALGFGAVSIELKSEVPPQAVPS